MNTEKKRKQRADICRRYCEKNREKTNYIKAKSSAKSFIVNKATTEDLDLLIDVINTKKYGEISNDYSIDYTQAKEDLEEVKNSKDSIDDKLESLLFIASDIDALDVQSTATIALKDKKQIFEELVSELEELMSSES